MDRRRKCGDITTRVAEALARIIAVLAVLFAVLDGEAVARIVAAQAARIVIGSTLRPWVRW